MRIRWWTPRPMLAALAFVLATQAPAAPFDPSDVQPIGSFPVRVTAGDLDGDGLADLVACNSISRDLSVLMNEGGSLVAEVRIDPGGEPRQVAIADVDADGDRDLVVLLRGGDGLISVMKNHGDGTLAPPVVFGDPDLTFSFKLVDLDTDGDLDILTIGNFIDETLMTVLINDGSGAFGVDGVHTAAQTDVVYVADLDVADLNLDGLPDVATILLNSGALTVLFGEGGGDFEPFVPVDLGQVGPTALLARDLNRDGAADLVVVDGCNATNTLRVGLNDGTGAFTLSQVLPLPGACHSFTNPIGLAAGYFDGDTLIDLAYTSHDTASVRLLLNRGDGTFLAGDTITTDPDPMAVVTCDVDGNGSDDIVSVNLTETATEGTITTLSNGECAPLFTQNLSADGGGVYWETKLPYLAVRGPFTFSSDVSSFAVDLQLAATGTRLDDAELPASGTGFWYLVRPDCEGSSWTSGGHAEVGGRDDALP